MNEITVESLIGLMNARYEQIPNKKVPDALKEIIKKFNDLGEQLKEDAPKHHVKVLYLEEKHILSSRITIDTSSVALEYNVFDDVIDVSVKFNKDDGTLIDILSADDNGVHSARKKKNVYAEDMLDYFEQTDAYRTLVYFQNK